MVGRVALLTVMVLAPTTGTGEIDLSNACRYPETVCVPTWAASTVYLTDMFSPTSVQVSVRPFTISASDIVLDTKVSPAGSDSTSVPAMP